MNTISASSAVVHSTQYQTVTESTYVRNPEAPIVPIIDRNTVPLEPHDNYWSPIDSNQTAGNHINLTV